jgi:hypothetical protein
VFQEHPKLVRYNVEKIKQKFSGNLPHQQHPFAWQTQSETLLQRHFMA